MFSSVTTCRTVNFYGTILGGTSFAIPRDSLSYNNGTDIGFNSIGFNWTVNIASGTQVLFIGNDDRGIGSGGKALFSVEDTPNNSCLNVNSPSSTPGSPRGSYPTAGIGEPASNSGVTHSSS